MSRRVTQQLTIMAPEALKIVNYIAGSDSAIDFHKIIPVPHELNIEETSEGYIGLAAISGKCEQYLTFPWVTQRGIHTPKAFTAYVERERPKSIELARLYVANNEKYGHATWRRWCGDNWGTEWNAYDVGEWETYPHHLSIRFCTINSPAIRAIEQLSQHFEGIDFTLRYFHKEWVYAGEAFFYSGFSLDQRFKPVKTDSRTRFVYSEVYGTGLD